MYRKREKYLATDQETPSFAFHRSEIFILYEETIARQRKRKKNVLMPAEINFFSLTPTRERRGRLNVLVRELRPSGSVR